MRKKLKLEFSIDDLPQWPKDILRRSFQVNDDEHHLWCDLGSILDGIEFGGGTFPGVEAPKIVNEPPTVDDIPKSWWKLMAFPPRMAKAMKAFWKENPEGEVEWKW